MKQSIHGRWMLLALMLLVLAGCRESAQPTQSAPGYDIRMEVEPQPAAVGESTLLIGVFGADGSAVRVERLDVRGDMNHAGMVPVLRTIEEPAENGQFIVPFEWTMSGEWIVTITAALADGQTVTQDHTLNVGREGASSGMQANPLTFNVMDLPEPEDCDAPPVEEEQTETCGVVLLPEATDLLRP